MIYLLRTSQHNEDFYIDGGYATNDVEIEAIARKYVESHFCTFAAITVVVDHKAKQVTAGWDEWGGRIQTFYLTAINRHSP